MAGQMETGSAGDGRLPQIREDLVVHSTGRDMFGAPCAVIADPAAGAYYQIGWAELEIVTRWREGSNEAIAAAVRSETTLAANKADIEVVAHFLKTHSLIRQDAAALRTQAENVRRQKQGPVAILTGTLLAWRIPLCRPQRFLDATLPIVRPLFSRNFFIFVAALLVLALYLVVRQWPAFSGGLRAILSLEGAIAIGATLTVAKCVHELAHAYAATRYRVAVPSMGLMFILLWPVLYTDASAAWTLGDRRARIAIASAGVLSELVLASFALLAWSFMADGALRHAMLFATTTLIGLTLLVNLNPFMRFDGYFVLAEALGMDNLQPRALALVTGRLRRLATGLPQPEPEARLTRGRHASLIAYGIGSLLYRIVLYGGIAYMVHLMLPPFLGVPLALGILAAFLVRPVLAEIGAWFRMAVRDGGGLTGVARVVAFLAVPIAILVIPWQTTVTVPVIWRDGAAHLIYPPEAGRLTHFDVDLGTTVAAGAVIARIKSPEILVALNRAELRSAALDRALQRRVTSQRFQQQQLVQASELVQLHQEIAGYRARLERLAIRAPVDGRVMMVATGLGPQTWVATTTALAQIVAPGQIQVVGFATEQDIRFLEIGATGQVWLEGEPTRTVPVQVRTILIEPVKRLNEPILAAAHQGPIAVTPDAAGGLVPEVATYRVDLAVAPGGPDRSDVLRETRGYARIATTPRSLLGRIWSRIAGVWRREVG